MTKTQKERSTVHPTLQDAQVQRWLKEAEEVSADVRLDTSLDELLMEAPRLAAAAQRLWEPTEARPGLASVGDRIGEELPAHIASLCKAVQRVHDAVEEAIDQSAEERGLGEQARFLLRELRSVLTWTAEALALEAPLHEPWKYDEEPADVLVAGEELEALIATARAHQETVHSVAGYDEELLAKAADSVLEIQRLQSVVATQAPAVKALLVARRRLALLLQARIRLLNSAARYVFRAQPTLLSELRGQAPKLSAADQRHSAYAVSKRHERQYPRHLPMV